MLLLDALYRAGPPHRITPTQLKHRFLITLADVGKRVARLEERGVIARRPNPAGGRGQYIELTDSGRETLASLARADADAPHIIWPTLLSASEFEAVEAALVGAEALIANHERQKRNDRSS